MHTLCHKAMKTVPTCANVNIKSSRVLVVKFHASSTVILKFNTTSKNM